MTQPKNFPIHASNEKQVADLMDQAMARARVERLYFKHVVIPKRMREIEAEFNELLQAIAPGAQFVLHLDSEHNEVKPEC